MCAKKQKNPTFSKTENAGTINITVIPLCFTLASRQRASSGANTPTATNGRIYRKSLRRRMRNAFIMQNSKCKAQSENAERTPSGKLPKATLKVLQPSAHRMNSPSSRHCLAPHGSSLEAVKTVTGFCSNAFKQHTNFIKKSSLCQGFL